MARRFDLVLLDLQMPRMDGMELLSRLRAPGSIVPVVILTAHGSIPEAVTAMKLGAIDFLTKPITPEALRRVVAEVIERHAASPPLHRASRGKPEARRSLEASGLRPGAGQASLESRPVQRGRDRAARDPAPTSRSRPRPPCCSSGSRSSRKQESQGPYRILRDWFPEREHAEEDEAIPMMSIATLALGLAIFGLFFAMVAACDRL